MPSSHRRRLRAETGQFRRVGGENWALVSGMLIPLGVLHQPLVYDQSQRPPPQRSGAL